MREIKFRAWEKDEKKMYSHNSLGDSTLLSTLYATEHIKGKGNIELMQYTGLKDKNRKEIYEGDIVRRLINSRGNLYPSNYKRNVIKIEFINSAWSVRKQTDRIEIIGNIYENPELITK